MFEAFLYSGRDLNPYDHYSHWILSPACLPISPPKHFEIKKFNFYGIERKTGLEPATSTLARSRSTN